MAEQKWVRILPGTGEPVWSANKKILLRERNDNSFIVNRHQKRSGDEFLADMELYKPFIGGKSPTLELLSDAEVSARGELDLKDDENLPKNFSEILAARKALGITKGQDLPDFAAKALSEGKTAEELIAGLSADAKKAKK